MQGYIQSRNSASKTSATKADERKESAGREVKEGIVKTRKQRRTKEIAALSRFRPRCKHSTCVNNILSVPETQIGRYKQATLCFGGTEIRIWSMLCSFLHVRHNLEIHPSFLLLLCNHRELEDNILAGQATVDGCE